MNVTQVPAVRTAWVGGGGTNKVGVWEDRVDSALDLGNPLDLQHTVPAPGTST